MDVVENFINGLHKEVKKVRYDVGILKNEESISERKIVSVAFSIDKIPDEIKNNREAMISAIKIDGNFINYAAENIKNGE